MSKRTYQQYSPEFKREAVRLAEQTDGPITQVAREWEKQGHPPLSSCFPHGRLSITLTQNVML